MVPRGESEGFIYTLAFTHTSPFFLHTQNKNGTLIARSRSKAHDAQQRTIVNPADGVCGSKQWELLTQRGIRTAHFK